MAILDSEKLPRGLRMPSLSAMKSKKALQKKAPPMPEPPAQEPAPSPPSAFPPRNNGPSGSLEQPIQLPAPSGPLPDLPTFSASQKSADRPPVDRPPMNRHDQGYVEIPRPVRMPGKPPISTATSPPEGEEPLEDFIPDPEYSSPQLDTDIPSPREQVEPDPEPLTPPEMVEIAAPLAKVHFACYQDHRSMPISRNAWYSTPCMACHKQDREIRHRCVFCSLRICSGCFETLQKCQNRSLAQLVESLQ
ncbi:hypothetical protein MPDQ_004096 [Monascus purpureus]|uniref:Uncharacterized protein n=1 Tax=Monascus purpureus TaxID=5098 RepID=A0A507R1J7_MONPU|nr:hypothetical protein MPDQ_004096 [Monascus purpureus]BDD57895.1 hypothetical protein MAP00_003219 [Monascus purpureus]